MLKCCKAKITDNALAEPWIVTPVLYCIGRLFLGISISPKLSVFDDGARVYCESSSSTSAYPWVSNIGRANFVFVPCITSTQVWMGYLARSDLLSYPFLQYPRVVILQVIDDDAALHVQRLLNDVGPKERKPGRQPHHDSIKGNVSDPPKDTLGTQYPRSYGERVFCL